MADNPTIKSDVGGVNARILAREAKADFRRVEAASFKMRTHFTSAEAKRLFVRLFNTLQLNAYFVSVIARSRLDHQEVEAAETALLQVIDVAKRKLDDALDKAEVLFKAHGIVSAATYDTRALEIEVGILSSTGRRYLEVLGRFDQLMPLLQTLEIHEVITVQSLDQQRVALKRQVKGVAFTARRLAASARKRMDALVPSSAKGDIEKPRGGPPEDGVRHAMETSNAGAVGPVLPTEPGLVSTSGAAFLCAAVGLETLLERGVDEDPAPRMPSEELAASHRSV